LLVLVTGGTGYLGSHAIAALAEAGHRIRVLARSPQGVPRALAPLGVDQVETVTGGVTDPVAVERAVEGSEAVLHAASVFSMDPRRADEVRSVNVGGTDVLAVAGCRRRGRHARRRGCRRAAALVERAASGNRGFTHGLQVATGTLATVAILAGALLRGRAEAAPPRVRPVARQECYAGALCVDDNRRQRSSGLRPNGT
jgi:hypothetical protein